MDESSVSFTTASGKEVAFKAKRGRPKGSTKKVAETPVAPQNEPQSMDEMLGTQGGVDGKVFPVAIPQEPAPVAPVVPVEPEEPAPVAPVEPAQPVKMKPVRKAKAKAAPRVAPGISDKLPKKTATERPPELPAPETLIPQPPTERWTPSREEMHSMIQDYMRANKQNTRDSRVSMYRSWLTA